MSALVSNGHLVRVRPCPPYASKRTLTDRVEKPALCQKQTLRTLLSVSETIVVFSSSGAAGGAKIPLVGSKNGIGVNDKLDPRLSAFVQCLSA